MARTANAFDVFDEDLPEMMSEGSECHYVSNKVAFVGFPRSYYSPQLNA